ncbi:hypothetical protein Vadar_010708 [Vaccinium darrowii]|uniref:Uncharacterized protein n=1 Tax=Vaccinium darrowii TaxID=229202 RepID=A0ACB7YKW6_9ERIC|nr:hypothetical protein Vadar_010708 [Vaccinium darrowii]
MAGKGQGPGIGIDLGTTYSCVAVWQHDRVEIITNDQGNRTTPSYVAFTDTERLTGNAAKNQVAVNATNTIFEEEEGHNWIFSYDQMQDEGDGLCLSQHSSEIWNFLEVDWISCHTVVVCLCANGDELD